jgi:hypothetical protein
VGVSVDATFVNTVVSPVAVVRALLVDAVATWLIGFEGWPEALLVRCAKDATLTHTANNSKIVFFFGMIYNDNI